MYASSVQPQTYSYNYETGQISLPQQSLYSYREQDLLQGVNIAYFGFGVALGFGTSDQKLTVVNYNYVTDPIELRWKTID